MINYNKILFSFKKKLIENIGGFADVYIGSFKESEVAIKLLKMPNSENSTPHDMSHAEILSEARREIWLMSGLIHPNIIRLIGNNFRPSSFLSSSLSSFLSLLLLIIIVIYSYRLRSLSTPTIHRHGKSHSW